MGKFDEFIESATYRLKPDAELRMDVAHELRTHLEDAAEAARGEGATEADAEEQALRNFGDADQIAQKLWQANFRRMRLRSVAKWAFRLVAMPAAVLLAVLLCWEALGFLTLLSMTGSIYGKSGLGYLRDLLPEQRGLPYRNDLSPDDAAARDILMADSRSRYEDAQRLSERFPKNRMFRAHQAIYYFSFERPRPEFTTANVGEALALFDECERAEPENAFYNYLKAAVLFEAAGTLETDESFTYPTTNAAGKVKSSTGMRFMVKDADAFRKGMEEYRKGIAKPYCDDYALSYLKYYLSLRQTPDSLLYEVSRIAIAAGQLLPHLAKLRSVTRTVMAHAAELVEQGHNTEAADLIRTAPVAGTQFGERSEILISLLVARAMRQTALFQGAALYDKMGMGKLAEAARETARSESGRYGTVKGPSDEELRASVKRLHKHAGILGGVMLPDDPIPEALLTALRDAERANLERTALGVLALLFVLVIAFRGLGTVISMRRHRKDAFGPKFLFIGWKRLARVVLLAVVLPMAAYILLTRLPGGSAHYGVNYAPDRMAMELAGTILCVLGLSFFLGAREVRRRAQEAGMSVPTCRRSRFLVAIAWILGGLCALGTAWYSFHWQGMIGFGFVLCVGWVLTALTAWASAADRRWKSEGRQYLATERRSLIPILVACLIFLGVFARTYLHAAERSAIHTLQQPGMRLYVDELKYTHWGEYQEYLRGLPEKGAIEAKP